MSKAISKATSRTEHKERTRDALRHAALDLFATQGFDTTTADEIAERAGVSGRTFFRYFPTKETVLWAGEREWVESFTERYPNQVSTLSDVEAMCLTIIELAPISGMAQGALRLYSRAVASSVTLRGQETDHTREDTAKVAEAIAARRGAPDVDESCLLLASVGMMTYRRALDAWLLAPDGAELGPVIAAEFTMLAESLDR